MLPVLRLHGSPYEQGVQQGEAVGPQIARNWGQIRTLIESLIDGRDDWYRSLVGRNRGFIAQTDPDTIEELTGIADGSGMPLDDVLAMNLPMYTSLRRARIIEECSVYGASSSVTRDGRSYLLKTRDQPVDQFQFEHVVAYRAYRDGHRIVEVNAAGIITNPGSGINDAGLAVGTAGSWSKQHMDIHLADLGKAHAMPDMHYLLRHAENVTEAHEVLRETPRLAGMNIIVADRDGAIGTVEVTHDDAILTLADDGISAITNHYLHPGLQALNDPAEKNPSSHMRYKTITGWLRKRRGDITAQDMLRLSMDHTNGPQNSVCRHAPDGTGSTTRYMSLMTVEDFETWTFCDNPCRMALVVRAGEDDVAGETAGLAYEGAAQ
jgi:isopenicillin-N N-acyltransferase-like protein